MPSPFAASPNAPANDAVVVTPSNSANIPRTRALWVGGAGDIKLRMASGNDVVWSAVGAGSTLPAAVIRVWDTGTSASLILALY